MEKPRGDGAQRDLILRRRPRGVVRHDLGEESVKARAVVHRPVAEAAIREAEKLARQHRAVRWIVVHAQRRGIESHAGEKPTERVHRRAALIERRRRHAPDTDEPLIFKTRERLARVQRCECENDSEGNGERGFHGGH